MSFSFGTPHTVVGHGVVTVDKRLYLTEDEQRLVEEGHPDARWLWCTPGMQVPHEQAEFFGLLAEPEPDPEPEPEPVEEKAAAPAANKARRTAANK